MVFSTHTMDCEAGSISVGEGTFGQHMGSVPTGVLKDLGSCCFLAVIQV